MTSQLQSFPASFRVAGLERVVMTRIKKELSSLFPLPPQFYLTDEEKDKVIALEGGELCDHENAQGRVLIARYVNSFFEGRATEEREILRQLSRKTVLSDRVLGHLGRHFVDDQCRDASSFASWALWAVVTKGKDYFTKAAALLLLPLVRILESALREYVVRLQRPIKSRLRDLFPRKSLPGHRQPATPPPTLAPQPGSNPSRPSPRRRRRHPAIHTPTRRYGRIFEDFPAIESPSPLSRVRDAAAAPTSSSVSYSPVEIQQVMWVPSESASPVRRGVPSYALASISASRPLSRPVRRSARLSARLEEVSALSLSSASGSSTAALYSHSQLSMAIQSRREHA